MSQHTFSQSLNTPFHKVLTHTLHTTDYNNLLLLSYISKQKDCYIMVSPLFTNNAQTHSQTLHNTSTISATHLQYLHKQYTNTFAIS